MLCQEYVTSSRFQDMHCSCVSISLLRFPRPQVVDLMVIDTKGQHFVNRENTDKGKFAFTTDDYDVFEIW